jgi:hypothetical protein
MEGSILGRVKLNQTIVFESWSAVDGGFNPELYFEEMMSALY